MIPRSRLSVVRLADRSAGMRAQPRKQRQNLRVRASLRMLGERAQSFQQLIGLDRWGQACIASQRSTVLELVERIFVLSIHRIVAVHDGQAILHRHRSSVPNRLTCHRSRVHLQRAPERLGTAQQALLQVDEHQACTPPLWRPEFGVAFQQASHLELGVRCVDLHRKTGSVAAIGFGRLRAVRLARHMPTLVLVRQRQLDQQSLGETIDAELPEIALEPAHHDRLQRLGARDQYAAGEAHRIENFQQRAERIRMSVVWRRAQEQTVVELRREIAHGARRVAVQRVLAGRGGGCDMRLIENQQASVRTVTQARQQRIAIIGTSDDRIADDEAIVRRPRVDTETTLDALTVNILTVQHLEGQPEAAHHLVAPLKA